MIKNFSAPAQIFLLFVTVAVWQSFFELHEDADTHFVMNVGRYVLEHGFPHVDPFTVHENLSLVAQQWLSGIFFWETYKNFGVDGLKFLDCVVGAAEVLLYRRLCLLVSGGKQELSFWLSLFVAMMIMPATVPRPQIFSTLLLLTEVFLLENFTRTKNFKFLLPLPLVSVALINFHAAMWLMSLVLCLPFVAEALKSDTRNLKPLMATTAGIFLCGLINPYGVDAMTYVFRSYGVEIINDNVAEMFTPSAHEPQGMIFYLTAAVMIFSAAKFKFPWRYIFLSGGLIFMAVMHLRNVPLFCLLATFPLAGAWKNLGDEKFCKRFLPTGLFLLLTAFNTVMIVSTFKDGLGKISALMTILLFVSTLIVLYNLLVLRRNGRLLHAELLPQKNLSLLFSAFVVAGIYAATLNTEKPTREEPVTAAIKFLLRSTPPEKISLYTPQDYGGIAGSLGVRYYIDSRAEVFLPANNHQKNILAEYLNFKTGVLNYEDFFRRYNFTHIIITSEQPFIYDALTADKNFRVVYESERVDGTKVTRCKIFIPPIGD